MLQAYTYVNTSSHIASTLDIKAFKWGGKVSHNFEKATSSEDTNCCDAWFTCCIYSFKNKLNFRLDFHVTKLCWWWWNDKDVSATDRNGYRKNWCRVNLFGLETLAKSKHCQYNHNSNIMLIFLFLWYISHLLTTIRNCILYNMTL